MQTEEHEFPIEYLFQPSADAEERLAEAYDLILSLVIEELKSKPTDGEACSTPSD